MTQPNQSRIYRVYGALRDTGEETSKLIESDTSRSAEAEANRLGMVVSGVEIEGTSPPARSPSSHAATQVVFAVQTSLNPTGDQLDVESAERVLWTDTPSQWCNATVYAISGLFFFLIIPLAVSLGRYLSTRSMTATLTNQRIRFEWGVFSRASEEIELFRVRDTTLSQTLLDRWRGIGSITVMSSDRSAKSLTLPGIRDPVRIREMIRAGSLQVRRAHGVRTVEND